jgi:large subunit ribosomal protein L28
LQSAPCICSEFFVLLHTISKIFVSLKVADLKFICTEYRMAKVCDICGKQPSVGHTVSHAHNLSKRRWLPNLRQVRVLVDGQVKRLKVCTKCLKAGKVTKAPHKARPKPQIEPTGAPVVAAPEEMTSAV